MRSLRSILFTAALVAAVTPVAGNAQVIGTVARAPTLVRFYPPVALPGSDTFTEPSISIAPRGTKERRGSPQTIYATAPIGLGHVTRASPLWRSDDGGKTWAGPIRTANVGPLETGLGGGDADIKTDRAGNVYLIDLWLGNDSISISQDKGESWIGSPISHLHVGDDRAWLGYSAKENSLYMTYDGLSAIYVDKVDLDTLGPEGALLFPQESVLLGTVGSGASPGSIVVDDSRPGPLPYVYVLFGGLDGLVVARSDDGGLTFSHHVIPGSIPTGGSFEVGAVDSTGTLYVAWDQLHHGQRDVFFASSRDHGESWRGPWNVSALIGPRRTTLFPAIAAEGRGHVGLAFYGTPRTVDNNTASRSTQWNLYYAETRRGTASRPAFALTNVAPRFHNGQISTQGFVPGPSPDRTLGDFFSVAFDARRRANIVYTFGPARGPSQLGFLRQR